MRRLFASLEIKAVKKLRFHGVARHQKGMAKTDRNEIENKIETMNKIYAIVGAGMIGNVAREISCQNPDIVIVENIEDISKENIFPVKNFEIEPLVFTQPYAFDSEYRRKKKPKNQDWQMRIKQLQRRT